MLLPTSSGDVDTDLVMRLRAGDERAFDEIVHRHRPRLLAFARRILRDRPDAAEDVVQEALMRAHRALRRDDRVIVLGPWLAKLTRNCALDEVARVRSDSVPLDAPAAAVALVDDDTPDARHERRAALETMLAGIATLPVEQRHALIRREVDGASHADVAGELGITTEASRALVFRARANLAKQDTARDARCNEVQTEILRAHRAGRRASVHAHRHLAGCRTCRAYRGQLRALRRALHALHPGGLLMLGVIAGKLGLGSIAAAKSSQAGAVTVAALSVGAAVTGSMVFHAGQPSPQPIRSAVVPGGFVDRGAPLPAGTAVVTQRAGTVGGATVVRLSCPSGHRVADLLPPAGGAAAGYVRPTVPGRSRVATVALTGAPRAVNVAVLCKVPDRSGAIGRARLAHSASAPKPLVVCAPRAYLRTSPGGHPTGSVHGGQPLRVLKTRAAWRQVVTEFGAKGWLPDSALCG